MKRFSEPQAEVVRFQAADVIATSLQEDTAAVGTTNAQSDDLNENYGY